MTDYYVDRNARESGYREVHTRDYLSLPDPEHRIFLGAFARCQAAVARARQTYSRVDGCCHCCAACRRH